MEPQIHVIAGPNGAGKTTFAKEFLPLIAPREFLNADSIAAGFNPVTPEASAYEAARFLLNRWKNLVENGKNFAFESTLSGKTYASLLTDARKKGYTINIVYLWLPNVELSLKRIKRRVHKGGHNVPEEDVRRRFYPSLKNFFDLYLPLADEATLWDLSTRPPSCIAKWRKPREIVFNRQIYERIKRQVS